MMDPITDVALIGILAVLGMKIVYSISRRIKRSTCMDCNVEFTDSSSSSSSSSISLPEIDI